MNLVLSCRRCPRERIVDRLTYLGIPVLQWWDQMDHLCRHCRTELANAARLFEVDPVVLFRSKEVLNRLDLLEDFFIYHGANPHVFNWVNREVRTFLKNGHKRIGVSLVWEQMRYLDKRETASSDFKLPNNHRAYYGRFLMHMEPDLEGRISVEEFRPRAKLTAVQEIRLADLQAAHALRFPLAERG